MKTHHVEVHSNGHHGTIKIDGQDVSTAVRRIELAHQAWDLPEIELTLLAVSHAVDAQARVHIDSASRDLLIALGWTPPAGES